MIIYLWASVVLYAFYGVFYVFTLPLRLIDLALSFVPGIYYFISQAFKAANAFGYYNPPFADFMSWVRFMLIVTLFLYIYKFGRFVIRMVRGA